MGGPELIHISKVTQENRKAYTYECPSCHIRLRPRLGKKNRHCFYHDNGSRCAMDKYIHDTAERLLKEKFDRDEPFEIEMSVTKQCKNFDDCKFAIKEGLHACRTTELKKFNLKDHYQVCYVEKQCGEFSPDLMLVDKTGNHASIFIEIWHKHKSDDIKLQSENRIIEIRLKEVDELQPLAENPITEFFRSSGARISLQVVVGRLFRRSCVFRASISPMTEKMMVRINGDIIIKTKMMFSLLILSLIP